jgi:hypothetical protein
MSGDTTTVDLLGLRDWLASLAVTHVAMESTGVYWKPIFYVLEGWIHRVAGQRPALEACARPEIGCARQRVDCAALGERVTARQFCAASAHSRFARSHAVSQEANSGTNA